MCRNHAVSKLEIHCPNAGKTGRAVSGLPGFDLRPDFVVKPGVRAEVFEEFQFGHDLWRRIDGRIVQTFRFDEWPGGVIRRGELSEVGQLRADPGVKNEVDELLGQVAMRRFGRHSQIVEPYLAALPRYEIDRVRVISRSPHGLATVNDGCAGCFRQYFILGADAAIEANATTLGIENQIARFLKLRRVGGIKAVAFVFERGAEQIADGIDEHERAGLALLVEKKSPG